MKPSQLSISLAIGHDSLEAANGDLAIALRQADLQLEVVLAWLDREIRRSPGEALELVHYAGEILDKHHETIIA